MGRKATGPSGIAGLPKQKEFCGPVVYTQTGLFVFGREGIFEMETSSSEVKRNVLVVDDNESIREVLIILLSRRGQRIKTTWCSS